MIVMQYFQASKRRKWTGTSFEISNYKQKYVDVFAIGLILEIFLNTYAPWHFMNVTVYKYLTQTVS
jgi:hypothetical protein